MNKSLANAQTAASTFETATAYNLAPMPQELPLQRIVCDRDIGCFDYEGVTTDRALAFYRHVIPPSCDLELGPFHGHACCSN